MVDKSKPLLVVDLQTGFLKNGAQVLVPRIRQLIDCWTGAVYYLRYKNYPGSMYTLHLDWHDFMTSNDHEIVPGLYKDGCEIYDHFGYAPPLALIEKLKPESAAYICGLDTDACVMAAVFALWDAEVRPIVLSHYCGCSDGESFHRAALDTMLRQFGTDGVVQNEVR